MSVVVEWTPRAGGPMQRDLFQSSEWDAVESQMPPELLFFVGQPGDDPGQAWLELGPEHIPFLEQQHARPEWGRLRDTVFAHLMAAIREHGRIQARGW